MATQSWSSPVDTTTTAGFRAWGSELSAKFAAVGLVQASDTGQINWTTVNLPGSGAYGGYEIWRFNDSLQATAPIFIKIEYGAASTINSSPGLRITVGTGSNGAGTLTGIVSSVHASGCASGAGGGSATSFPSYLCHAAGFLGLAFKVGWGQNTPAFAIIRFSDDDGTPNGDGFSLHVTTGISATTIAQHTVQSIRTAATAIVFSANNAGAWALWPHGLTANTTTATGDTQAVPSWCLTRRIQQEFAFCAVLSSELSAGTTFSTALKGITPRTFIALGAGFALGGMGSNGTDPRCAFLWE